MLPGWNRESQQFRSGIFLGRCVGADQQTSGAAKLVFAVSGEGARERKLKDSAEPYSQQDYRPPGERG